MRRKANVVKFDHVWQFSGRTPDELDRILICVGDADWWSVKDDLESAIVELSLYYRIEYRLQLTALNYRVFRYAINGKLNLG